MSDQREINMKLIMERIRTVLAMTKSPNEAEAATASEMAHRMLKEYNLSMSDLEVTQDGIIEETYDTYNRISPWKSCLLAQIFRTNYCENYRLRHKYKGGGNGIRFDSLYTEIIVGRPANVATAHAMADYLIGAVERLSKEFKGERSERSSYKVGVSDTLRLRLQSMIKQEAAAVETTALVRRETALVEKYMKEKKGLVEGKPADFKITDLEAYLRGIEDGKGISLNTQLNGESKRVQPQLTLGVH